MAQIAFIGGSYLGRSPNVDASRSVNWFLENYPDNTTGKAQAAMVGTPGLNLFALAIGASTSAVRGLTTFNNVLYGVIDSKLYSIASDGTPTIRGTLTTSTGRCLFENNGVLANGVGGNQLMIVDGANGYIYNASTHVFSTISGGGWPGTPTSLQYLDGYFISGNSSMSYWVSDLYDGLTWNALATSPVSATSDSIKTIVNHRQQLFFLKEWTTEVWYNNGTPTATGSPFSRVSGAVYDYGIAAPWSIANGGNSFFFLCTQRVEDGGEIVGVAEVTEYSPVIISTPAINYKISQSTNFTNIFGYCYSEQGHMFYVMTNPTDDWTIVWDATTKMWHERSSFASNYTTVKRHASNCYAYCYGKHFVGDYRNSNIYEMSATYLTDNGNAIYSFRTAQTMWDNQGIYNIFISKLIIDIETGIGTDTPVIVAVTPFKAGWGGNATATYKGTYGAGTPYSLHDIVLYSTVQYICIQAGTGQQPDTATTYWSTPIPNILILANGNITGAARYDSSVDPLASLSWSNDGGHTWSAEYTMSLGQQADYSTRLIWRRLGHARNRVFKLGISASVKKNLIGAYVEVAK